MSDTNTVELDVGDSESIDVEVNENLEVETDSSCSRWVARLKEPHV